MTRAPQGYRILSLDGGGVRGVCTATILERLENREPGWLREVDLFAGTSTGAILALALAAGASPGDMVRLYTEQGATVFRDSWLDNLRDLGRSIGAAYDTKPLYNVLRGVFGDMTLGDLRVRVLVPAFDLDSGPSKKHPRMWKPKFFHNFPGPGSDRKERVLDVVMRSCASPSYFPSYQGYIDGGVVANNPGMSALAQALDRRGGRQDLQALRLLSVGTGVNPTYIRGQHLDWGVAQWAKPMLSLMVEGMTGVADFQCRQLLGKAYHRLSPVLPERISLDAHEKVERLRDIGTGVNIAPTLRWLRGAFLG